MDSKKRIMNVCDLRDMHKNELCFIVGAGPSLHFIDSSLLRGNVVISVNSGLLKTPFCDYFVSDDQDVSTWDYYTNLLPTLSCIKLLYRNKLENHCKHLHNVVLFNHTWWYSPTSNTYNPDGIILRKEEPIIGAINSVGSALHIAYIMGCNPVVLLGCDCCYKDGHRYFWQYNGETVAKRVGKNYRKIHDSYFEHEYSDKSVHYWNELVKANKDVLKSEMVVIDSSDGILDCFPKMTINDIVKMYKRGKILDGQ